jgi:hypothetical protein
MEDLDLRANERRKVAIQVVISDREQQNTVRSVVQDASICGCRIFSKQVTNLPEDVLLRVPNLSQSIKGHIVWRSRETAGIAFDWTTLDPNDKRSTPRQDVEIKAVISDREHNKLADCIILDANSKSCRIGNVALYTVPDDIHVQVEGLSEPVLAKLVWRNGNTAGLEFYWECDILTLCDPLTGKKI